MRGRRRRGRGVEGWVVLSRFGSAGIFWPDYSQVVCYCMALSIFACVCSAVFALPSFVLRHVHYSLLLHIHHLLTPASYSGPSSIPSYIIFIISRKYEFTIEILNV